MNSPKVTDLSKYNNSWYTPGAGMVRRVLWYFTNALFFQNPLSAFSYLKVILLRIFGAKIGRGVVVKPSVNIKYPWLLEVGDFSWIGERVWIDNLVKVRIGKNCCLSQGAILLTGNHDYSKSSFDLMVGDIILEEGVWIGARSMVGPGVVCRSHAVLLAYSVATNELEPYKIYRGNPAEAIKERKFKEA